MNLTYVNLICAVISAYAAGKCTSPIAIGVNVASVIINVTVVVANMAGLGA